MVLTLFSAPIYLIAPMVTRPVPEIGDRGGVVNVEVGPTPRSGNIVLGLVYLTIPQDRLGRIKLLIEADPRDLGTGKVQQIWLELWTGRISPDESVWWENRVKLAQSSSDQPRLSYVPIVRNVMTLAIVWIKSKDLDTITVRVNITSIPVEVTESKPTVNDLVLEDSDTPDSPVFDELVNRLGRDPTMLFEYVRNNVFFDLYWGLLRGALRTYYDGYGNSLDQSSLLIALLRRVGIPAHYAFGVVNVSKTVLVESLGLRDTPQAVQAAVEISKTAGLLYYEGERYVMLYHVWVRAYIDGSWRDLDPSFKKVIRRTESPITGLSSPPSAQIAVDLREVFRAYMEPLSDLPVSDLSKGHWIVTEHGLKAPPGNYVLIGLYSKLPDEYRGFITVYYPRWAGDARGYDFSVGNYSFTVPTSALGAYRLTGRFVPASKEDADYIASLPNGLSGVKIADRRILVRPQFLLNGFVISVGDAALPGFWLPVKMKFTVSLPSGYRFIGWGDESLLGYAAYVLDFMKTKSYGEVGIEGARGIALSFMNPELTRGIDRDEVVGRILYLQARRYQIERWHQIEKMWNYRLVVQIFPLNVHKAEYYQLINSGGRLVIGPPMFSAGIGWNSWASYLVVDPEQGLLSKYTKGVTIKDLDPSTIPSYLPGSFYEGEVVRAIHGTIPYSTVHTFMYAAARGIRIIHVNRENVTALPSSIPKWIRDSVVRIVDEWRDLDFNAFMPESPVPPDVLSIFVSDDPSSNPPEVVLAGEMFGVLTVIPLSRYHAAVGALIYNLGRGVELGGGALSSTEQNSYIARAETSDSGTYYSQLSSPDDKDSSKKIAENFIEKFASDRKDLVAGLNDIDVQLSELEETLKKMDPNDPEYASLLQQYQKLREQRSSDLYELASELAKMSFQLDLLYRLIEDKIPVFFKPDGSLMEVTELVKYLSDMGVDKETRLQIILNQREAIQKARTLGYIEIPYQINGDNVILRLNYAYKVEVQTSYGYQFASEFSSEEIAKKALSNYLEDLTGATGTVSYALSKIEIIPQEPITLSYKVQGGLLGVTTQQVQIDQITLTPDQLGGGLALDPILKFYSEVKSISNDVLNDWKYSKANLPGGEEAKPLYEFWNLNESQVQRIKTELEQGVLPPDPPFIEAWIENALGEFAGYNPDLGYGYGLNFLAYSGVGSKPKHLAVYSVWPGLYYINVIGTKEGGVEGTATITYKVGDWVQSLKIPIRVGYGELVKIPIVVDKYQRVAVEEPKPGVRIRMSGGTYSGMTGTPLTLSGRILDQFGRQGVAEARVQVTVTSPDGSITSLGGPVASGADGSFTLTFTPREAGIHYITVSASAEGFYPSTLTVPVAVHAVVKIVNDLRVPGDLLKASLRVEGGEKEIEVPLGGNVALPAGRYSLSFSGVEYDGWRLTPNREPRTSFLLSGNNEIRLSDYFSASVRIDALSDMGRVEGSGWYRLGETATISATPPPDGSYRFAGWEGDVKSTQNPLVIQVEKPLTIRAKWEVVPRETGQTTTTQQTLTETTDTIVRETTAITTTDRSGGTDGEVQTINVTILMISIALAVLLLAFFILRRRVAR